MPFYNDIDGIASDAYLSPCLQLSDDLFGGGNGITLPAIGEYWASEGGYYAGLIRRNNGDIKAVVAMPRQFSLFQANQPTLHVPNMTSLWDGQKNFEALMAWAGYSPTATSYTGDTAPAPHLPLNQTSVVNGSEAGRQVQTYPGGVNGKRDWRIPALYELNLLFRAFKPDTGANAVGVGAFDGLAWGANPALYPTAGVAHTASNPSQTGSVLFRTGGTEAFGNTALRYYMTSTEFYSSVGSYGTGTHIYTMAFTGGMAGAYGVDPKSDQTALRFVRYVNVG